jgi:biotin carboxylase
VGGLGFRRRRHRFCRALCAPEAHLHRAAPAAMRTLGDKVEAKLLAEKVGVPLAPWSGGPVETRGDARRHAGPLATR